MGESIRTMHNASDRQLVLINMQQEIKRTKEHSKEWYALRYEIDKMVAENLLRYVTK